MILPSPQNQLDNENVPHTGFAVPTPVEDERQSAGTNEGAALDSHDVEVLLQHGPQGSLLLSFDLLLGTNKTSVDTD